MSRGVLVWPGDLLAWFPGGDGTGVVAFPRRCRLCRRAGGVQLERPQPVRNERARTNELDAGKRRPIIGSEEEAFCGWADEKGRWVVPREVWLAEWSHMHPFGACLVGRAP